MINFKSVFFKLFGMLFCVLSTMAQKPMFTKAKTLSATVYFNKAELLQKADLKLPVGKISIVIKNIAYQADINTMQVSVSPSLTVLSVRSADYGEFPEEIQDSLVPSTLKDSISKLQKKINHVENIITNKRKTIALLDKNSSIYSENSNVQAMEAAEYIEYVEYYEHKHMQLADSIAFYVNKLKAFQESLEILNKGIKLPKLAEKPTAMILVQVMNSSEENAIIELKYFTTAASWQPIYDINVEDTTSPIKGNYKAQIIQNTGINWEKVNLELATGGYQKSGRVPELSPWVLKYKDIFQAVTPDLPSIPESDAEVVKNQPSVSFTIDAPQTINSDVKPYSLLLKQLNIKAIYKYHLTPQGADQNILVAEIPDYHKYKFLNGEATLYFGQMLIGKTQIESNKNTDTLEINLGPDPKVSANRVAIAHKTKDKLSSSKRTRVYAYDIVVKNTKEETVCVVLRDQYPISPDKTIKIDLLQKDGAYDNRESGILTWEIRLKQNETLKKRLVYRVVSTRDRELNMTK